jgi:hypothetical protein
VTALIRIDRSWNQAEGGRSHPIRFCSRCGHPGDEPPGRPVVRRRVCARCGMGMVLSCARDALPGDAAAFLICTFELAVSAVSQSGERVFGREDRLIGTHLLDHVTSPLGDDQLSRHAGLAAQRETVPVVMPLRLVAPARARRVGTLAARIASCGPPRAALVTVEPSEFGRR